MLQNCSFVSLLLFLLPSVASAKTVVFWQPGFPTIASQPLDQATLRTSLGENSLVFADIPTLNVPATLANTDLLVLPYGSAVPVDAWNSVETFLQSGGNLLVLGGQPLHVPVTLTGTKYISGRPQESYAHTLGIRHTYEIPAVQNATFTWKTGYTFGSAPRLQAARFFAVEGRLDGLGYMKDATGLLVAAPVIVIAHGKGRIVALDFDPTPGFWATTDGTGLIHQAASYAGQGTTALSIEALFSLLRPGESPQLSLHLHRSASATEPGEAQVEIRTDGRVVEDLTLPLPAGEILDIPLTFHHRLAPGFYQVAARYTQHQQLREFYQNGLWVSAPEALRQGPKLGVNVDTLTLNDAPFLPVGTNYFTTEENGWDFSGPRNAAVWEHDFTEMEAHGVSFVRTGVWMSNARFIDGDLGGADERFLRNLEALLLSAQHHHIAVNFTFFAFSPKSGNQRQDTIGAAPPNPYLNAEALRAQQAYVRSVVARFKDVPWLSWDLINEPSFSNPRVIFKGNYPNGDPDELVAWHTWLHYHYTTLASLGDAWSVTPEQLGSFDAVPLPAVADLTYERYGNPMGVRALDYNLFAQDSFSAWVKSLVGTIRQTGSTQLIDVGQDEGGVTDRVLNQFYGSAGLSFTTNHTYWQDDALLWDSVVAKRPGQPNITGETGYQPAWSPDGTWRYDELTGLGLTERKWALGFAAGSSGAMQWDWAREVDFGMQRSDGSAKVWENMMRDLGSFSKAAAPYATGLIDPQIALILPQSLQMSVLHQHAQEATQNAVRALYQQAHGQAYAVGEYQLNLLANPKLILLPSPLGLTEEAWQTILRHVKDGATLLVTGPFDGDAHLHPTSRQQSLGLSYFTGPLELREQSLHWGENDDRFTFSGQKTTVLTSATLPENKQWAELVVGKGQILFATLPLELGENLPALGRVYTYAMRKAGVDPTFTTPLTDSGILISPTLYTRATLYVMTSESNQQVVTFRDTRSGHSFSGTLGAGRAAILLVGTDGELITSYHWSD